MSGMTDAQVRRMHELQDALWQAGQAIGEAQAAWDEAGRALRAFEERMVREGRAEMRDGVLWSR